MARKASRSTSTPLEGVSAGVDPVLITVVSPGTSRAARDRTRSISVQRWTRTWASSRTSTPSKGRFNTTTWSR